MRKVLAATMVLALFVIAGSVSADSLSVYQHRLDVNRDGLIDIVDVQQVAGAWQTFAPDPIQPNRVNILTERYDPTIQGLGGLAGEIRNDSTSSVEGLDLYYAFYSDEGDLLYAGLLFPPDSDLAPGVTMPFASYAFPPDHAYHEIALSYDSTCKHVVPVTIVSSTVSIYLGDYRITGTLRNDNAVSVSSVDVYAGVYNSQNLVIDTGSDYCSTLAPNQTCDFDILYLEGAGYSHHTLQAYGKDTSPCQ